MDDDDQALPTIQQALPATGVTSFAATTMTMEQDVMETALKRIKAAKENYTGGAQVLGAHLEGPSSVLSIRGPSPKAYTVSGFFLVRTV